MKAAYAFRAVCCSLLFLSVSLFAQGLDIEAIRAAKTEEEALVHLPGQELSLPFIIAQAALSSDSFKSIMAQQIALEAPLYRARGLTETYAFAEASYLDSRLDTASPLSPSKILSTQASTGLERSFMTGTKLSARLVHERMEQLIDFAGAPPGLDFSSEYFDSRLEFGLEQPLWQNAFGRQLRTQVLSAEKQSERLKALIDEQLKEWFSSYSSIFYSAWLAQGRVRAARSNVQRRQRVLDMTRLRLERGTAERPDLLQAESALVEARSGLNFDLHQLQEIWRGLVIGLSLPDHWVNFDPMKIPLNPENALNKARDLCGPVSAPHDPPAGNSLSKQLQLMSEVASLQSELAMDSLRPEASLFLNATTNAVDADRASRTLGELRRVDHNAIRVGVNIRFPLGRSIQKGTLMEARAQELEARANYDESLKSLRVQWNTMCSKLYLTESTVTDLRRVLSNQRERVRLEEDRFRIGRVMMLALIQAGDDATFSELNLRRHESDLSLLSWQILRLKEDKILGLIETYVTELIDQPFHLYP